MRRFLVSGFGFLVSGFGFLVASAEVLPIAGEGWRKVDVTLEARATVADATFASDPELEILHGDRRLAGFSLQVRDAAGKRAIDAGSFRNIVWSGDWRTYVRRVWVPPAAKDVSVTAGKGCEIRDVRVSAADEPGLAVNGEFALGPYNYSGWRKFDRHVLVGCGADGKGLLNTCPDGCVCSEPIPVKSGVPLQLAVTWKNPAKKRLRVAVTFVNAQGKKCGDFVWNAPKPSGTYDFSAPDGAETMMVSFYEGRIERFSVSETKDERSTDGRVAKASIT